MDFTNVTSITIPEGEVVKIASGNTVLWEKVTSLIPKEYQQVEYIEKLRDTAYLDLGFSFDTACTCYIKCGKTSAQYGYFFGAAENSGAFRCMITGGADFILYGSTGSSFLSGSIADAEEMSVEFILKKGSMKLTNLLTGDTLNYREQGEYTMTNSLYLFGQNYNGSYRGSNTNVKLRYFSYYDKNGVMISELIPCYRKSDGVIGAYDRVRNIFLTDVANNLAGFGKGADVV